MSKSKNSEPGCWPKSLDPWLPRLDKEVRLRQRLGAISCLPQPKAVLVRRPESGKENQLGAEALLAISCPFLSPSVT